MKGKEQLAKPGEIPYLTCCVTNAAYLMSDVTDTMMLSAIYHIRKAGLNLSQEAKRNWKQAVEDTERAERSYKRFAHKLYENYDADSILEKSDWFANTIFLLYDRVGDNPERRDMITRMLLKLKSELHVYEQIREIAK